MRVAFFVIIDQWRVENSVNNNHKILIAIAGVAVVAAGGLGHSRDAAHCLKLEAGG